MNRIKISLLCLLTLFCFSAPLTAQNTPQGKKKKQEIIVPESVLIPYLNNDRIELRTKLFTDWLDSAEKVLNEYPPKTWKKNFGKVQPVLPGAAISRLNGMKELALDPELEEASKCYRQYYKDIYNTALPLYEISKSMERLVEAPDSEIQIGVDGNDVPVMKSAWPVYQAKFRRTLEKVREVVNQGPVKMPPAEWKKIVRENRAERAKKYIEEMEKAIAEGKMTLAQVNAKATGNTDKQEKQEKSAKAQKKADNQVKQEKQKKTKSKEDKKK